MRRSQRVTVSNCGICRWTISTVWSRSSITEQARHLIPLRSVEGSSKERANSSKAGSSAKTPVDVARRAGRDGASASASSKRAERARRSPRRAARRPPARSRAPAAVVGAPSSSTSWAHELAGRRRAAEIAAIARRPEQPFDQIVPDAGQPAVLLHGINYIELDIQKIDQLVSAPARRPRIVVLGGAGTAAAIRTGVAFQRPSKEETPWNRSSIASKSCLQELRLRPRRRGRRRAGLHRGVRQPARPPLHRGRGAGRLRAAVGFAPAGAGGAARRDRRAHQPADRRRFGVSPKGRP